MAPAAAAKAKKTVSKGKADSAFPIVGLGASAGGPLWRQLESSAL